MPPTDPGLDERRERDIEWATRESLRLEAMASQYRQLGFSALADEMTKNAKEMMKWAANR